MSERDEHGRWKPGTSGNPAGRTPGTIGIRSLIRARLAECPEPMTRTLGEEFAIRIVADAIKHDGQSRRLVLEHLEGKPRQAVEITPITPILDADQATDEVIAYLNEQGIVPLIDDLQ